MPMVRVSNGGTGYGGDIISYNTSFGFQYGKDSATLTHTSTPTGVIINCHGKTSVTASTHTDAYSCINGTITTISTSTSYDVTNYDYLMLSYAGNQTISVSVS